MRRLVVPFVLAAVLTGCSSTEQGTPTAGKQAPKTGTSTGTAPVNRPKAVDMKTLDPCSLITPQAKAKLGIRTVEPGAPDKDFGEGSKGCGTSYEDRKATYSIDTVVNGGVDRLKSTEGKVKEITELKVAGYPAYLTKGPSQATGAPQCEIWVDTHDGQLLRVSVIGEWGGSTTLDTVTERAKALAEAVGPVLATK